MPFVWIVFSSTPYQVGKLIRRALHTQFNHVSLSFSPTLSPMYSFSRRFINAPLVGGFVVESYRRFYYRSQWANIKVCRVRVTEKQYRRLRHFVAWFCRHADDCVYNFYSAAATLLNRRIRLRGCYTCVEFVGDALGYAAVDGFHCGDYHSLAAVERALSPSAVYIGSACRYRGDISSWGSDQFLHKPRAHVVVMSTLALMARLSVRSVDAAVRRMMEGNR